MKIVDITIKICNELTLNMCIMLKKSKNGGIALFNTLSTKSTNKQEVIIEIS